MTSELTIGKLADAAHVTVETIRYYQRRGLLDVPSKPQGGHRRYPRDMAKRIRFIKRAQVLGFALSDVGGLLKLQEAHACTETRALAAHKLEVIKQKIFALEAMRRILGDLVQECDSGRGTGCPIIDALAQE
ncbi:MerR family transcriptional regulator [Variovorax paradoxus]|nr:MerR family transcriptional regulator [Variovorax paradoxus]